MKKAKVIRAWADIGSHGKPFVFTAGPIWSMYGPLLHVWESKVSPDLVPVEIRIVPRPAKRGRKQGR